MEPNEGRATPASRAIMATTTSNSTKVKPERRDSRGSGVVFIR
jgi:hypothetical protein